MSITKEQRDRVDQLVRECGSPLATAANWNALHAYIEYLVAEPAERSRDAATDAPCVLMPTVLTYDDIKAIRTHGTTRIADRDDWYTRLGWLICAWDVLIARAALAAADQKEPKCD